MSDTAPDFDRLSGDLCTAVLSGDSAASALARAALVGALDSAGPGEKIALPGTVVPPGGLPKKADVYVISDDAGQNVYVGLALDVHHRFHNHDYGHLTPNNRCRSRHIIASGECVIRLLGVADGIAGRTELEQCLSLAEITTYVALRRAGYGVVNAAFTLGRVGESSGSSVVLCDHETGEYVFCETLDAANKFADTTALPAVVHHYQRTAVGYAARWATPDEVEAFDGLELTNGVLRGDTVQGIIGALPSRVDWDGSGRNAQFTWVAGPLSAHDIEQLNKYSRARYRSDIPTSEFRGVSWESRSQGWQTRAKTGHGSKDLWQTRRRAWTTDLDAAIFREEKIIENGWQAFNTGAYASNSARINELLGVERFAGW